MEYAYYSQDFFTEYGKDVLLTTGAAARQVSE